MVARTVLVLNIPMLRHNGLSCLRVSILSSVLVFGPSQVCCAQVPLDNPVSQVRTKIAVEVVGDNAPMGCSPVSNDLKLPGGSPHGVSLSWNPSAPVSKSPQDVILGYIVYRSSKSHDRNALPINYSRITGTTFSDCNVEAGKTYYYTTRAVDATGRISGPSNEVRVKIPTLARTHDHHTR